jgi:integrase
LERPLHGTADLSPHDCRHTWATWHYAANRDIIALMKLGGWKWGKMVLRYAHVNVSHLAGSMNALPWNHPSARVLGG